MFDLLGFLLIGLIAGWLAGKLVKGRGFGLGGDLAVGVIGALIGGFLFQILGLTAHSTCGAVIMATIGAVLLLFAVQAARGKR